MIILHPTADLCDHVLNIANHTAGLTRADASWPPTYCNGCSNQYAKETNKKHADTHGQIKVVGENEENKQNETRIVTFMLYLLV